MTGFFFIYAQIWLVEFLARVTMVVNLYVFKLKGIICCSFFQVSAKPFQYSPSYSGIIPLSNKRAAGSPSSYSRSYGRPLEKQNETDHTKPTEVEH